jgi:hypothetical protein
MREKTRKRKKEGQSTRVQLQIAEQMCSGEQELHSPAELQECFIFTCIYMCVYV